MTYNKATALVLLSAASKSGDPGAILLAAQLAEAAPCETCGYVNFHCRCGIPAPSTWIDEMALAVARRFTLDTQPQLRANLQCAVIEAMKAAQASPAQQVAAEPVSHRLISGGP